MNKSIIIKVASQKLYEINYSILIICHRLYELLQTESIIITSKCD